MTMLLVLMLKFLLIFLANENVVSAHVNMSKFLLIFLANENVVSTLLK
jgi:hypothetical protein